MLENLQVISFVDMIDGVIESEVGSRDQPLSIFEGTAAPFLWLRLRDDRAWVDV